MKGGGLKHAACYMIVNDRNLLHWYLVFGGSWLEKEKYLANTHCITKVKYDFSSNVITFHVWVGEPKKLSENYETEGADQIAIGTEIADGIAQWIGAGDQFNPFSVIGRTPIRHGWQASSFDETAIRKEIANRAKLEILIKPGESPHAGGYLGRLVALIAIRDTDGGVAVKHAKKRLKPKQAED